MSTTGTTSYTFRILNSEGSVFGKGCFTHEGPAAQTPLTHPAAVGPRLTALWYHDVLVGTLSLEDVRAFSFSPDRFSLELSTADNARALSAGSASAQALGPVSLHRGAQGDLTAQGRALEFPRYVEGVSSLPLVDLVVVVDASKSMRDEAGELSGAVSAAIKAARTRCPSDLRVTSLGIEGTFEGTLFGTTVRDYLTQQLGVQESVLRGRRFTWVAGGKVREDGARAIEDVAAHFDWRPNAQRAVLFLGDEALEAGGRKVRAEDVAAANQAIQVALTAGVRVHTYLGTSKAKGWVRDALRSEYARVARETRGQAFTFEDSLGGFQGLLEGVICGSKPPSQEFCCCQAAVVGFVAPLPLPVAVPLPVPVTAPLPVPVTAPLAAPSGFPTWLGWAALWLLLLALLVFSAMKMVAPPSGAASPPVPTPAPAPAPTPAPVPVPVPTQVVVEKGQLRTLDKVFFAIDKDTAVAESLPILDQVAQVLQSNPDIQKLRIEAHTDNASSAAYNLDLSTRRARWVLEYLIQKGIAPERLESAGFGMSRPIDTNDTPEGRANNRRVEFVIVQ